MIPDARLWGPAGAPKCDCLKKTQAARYRKQYSCAECEPIIAKIERMSEEELLDHANALIEEMNK